VDTQTDNTSAENNAKFELYTGVRGIAIKVLNRIDRTDAYLDKMLDHELRNSELNGQDKALLFELVHGVLRWLNRIDWILNGFYKGAFSKSIPNVKNALRVALYQILFLDKIPDYAAVNEAVEFIKKLQGQKPADQANAVLRNIIRNKEGIRFPDPAEDIVAYYSTYYSHPAWLIKRWLNQFGKEETEKLLIANNEKPALILRVNTLKVSVSEFKELLKSVDLKFSEGKFLDNFIRLKTLTNITGWEYFEKGYFSIQDESTGFPGILLDVKPGQRVLDLCAAPGGKTAHLSNIMNNKGEIVALDRYDSRLKILDKNLKRLGINNVKLVEINALNYQDSQFDRVLLDAPCSGLGTISKKPDIKWKRDLIDIRNLTSLQYELLKKAASLVKPGGSIVYCTCTIEPEENFDIISKFLSEFKNFKLKNALDYLPEAIVDSNGCIQTYPHIHQIDGSFAAKLLKSE
jgi:16S rRNA (cytosine967-C5)-methyltransferase